MVLVVELGTFAIDDFTGVKYISALGDPGKYNTFVFPVGTPYQVEAGKTLRIGKLQFSSDTGPSALSIGYGDTVVVDSVAPPVNAVYPDGWFSVEVAYRFCECKVYFIIPAGKYPFMYSLGGVINCHLLGNEQ